MTTVFHRYGGEVWLFTLIATGRVHAESVRIVNEIYEERIREQAGREPVSDPAQAVPGRALASSQGQSREVVGVQHTKIPSALLRDAARHADKKWKWHDESWWDAHARGRLSARAEEWYRRKSVRLQEDADQQWAVANEESDKVGGALQGARRRGPGETNRHSYRPLCVYVLLRPAWRVLLWRVVWRGTSYYTPYQARVMLV